MIHELDCYTQNKYQTENVSNLDKKNPVKKTEMYQTTQGGDIPPSVKKTNKSILDVD